MTQSSTGKLLLWAVVILIVANITLLFFLFRDRGDRRQGEQPHVASFLEKELALDSAQKQSFEKLKQQHEQRTQEIRRAIRDEKDELFDHFSDSLPSIQKDSITKMIGDNMGKLEVLTFDHFRQVRQMLNKQQQDKFDKIIQKVLRMMAPPPPPPPGARPPGVPPPPGAPGEGDRPLPPPPPEGH
jgi:periplasmic protein CpxP/Spy